MGVMVKEERGLFFLGAVLLACMLLSDGGIIPFFGLRIIPKIYIEGFLTAEAQQELL